MSFSLSKKEDKPTNVMSCHITVLMSGRPVAVEQQQQQDAGARSGTISLRRCPSPQPTPCLPAQRGNRSRQACARSRKGKRSFWSGHLALRAARRIGDSARPQRKLLEGFPRTLPPLPCSSLARATLVAAEQDAVWLICLGGSPDWGGFAWA
jgi:hypothetical protein